MNAKYDVIVVLGAVMRWDPTRTEWTFPHILSAEEYPGHLVLGDWRARAAAELATETDLILVTGGSNKHPDTGETCSRAEELTKLIIKYGAPEEKVAVIGKHQSSHTMGNMDNIAQDLASRFPTSRLTSEHPEHAIRVAILCPRFQMPRAMVMYYNHDRLKGFNLLTEWLEVERTLITRNVIRQSEVNEVYNTPEADVCWHLEQKGMKALLEGAYGIKI